MERYTVVSTLRLLQIKLLKTFKYGVGGFLLFLPLNPKFGFNFVLPAFHLKIAVLKGALVLL